MIALFAFWVDQFWEIETSKFELLWTHVCDYTICCHSFLFFVWETVQFRPHIAKRRIRAGREMGGNSPLLVCAAGLTHQQFLSLGSKLLPRPNWQNLELPLWGECLLYSLIGGKAVYCLKKGVREKVIEIYNPSSGCPGACRSDGSAREIAPANGWIGGAVSEPQEAAIDEGHFPPSFFKLGGPMASIESVASLSCLRRAGLPALLAIPTGLMRRQRTVSDSHHKSLIMNGQLAWRQPSCAA